MSTVSIGGPITLRPTAQAYVLPAGDLVLHTGGDEFLVPDLPPEQLAALAGLLNGTRTLPDGASAFPDGELDAVLAVLEEEGIVARGSGEPGPPPLAGTVAVDGEGRLAEALTGLLARSGLRVLAVPEDGPPPAADVLVACAGWLPDRRWRDLDRICEQRGLPWHRAHRDGRFVWIGPFTLPGVTAGYTDSRRRQLAATDAPELLEGLWAHLDAGAAAVLAWPDEGALAMVAGALASDVLGHLRDGAPPSGGDQLELDLATRRWTAHPVLPVPRDLLTEPAP